jgi:hypothetical protein
MICGFQEVRNKNPLSESAELLLAPTNKQL